MKKGQVSEILLYIAGGIIAAIAIYYGVNSAIQLKETGEKSTIEILKSNMRKDIETISKQFGSNRTFSYNIAPFTKICFSDTTKNADIIKDDRVPLIINESAATNSSNNVFLFGEKTEAFYAGEIRICMKNVTCFNATQGFANVKIYGGGGFALLEPCAPIQIPIPLCQNSSSPIYLKYEVNDISEATDWLMSAEAIDTATPPGQLNIKWIIKNATGNIIETEEETKTSNSISSLTYTKANITKFGIYTFTMVATNEYSKQCSVKFTRIILPPGAHFPEAKIIAPEGDMLQPNTVIEFKGRGNDSAAGQLTASWDWGDGETTDCYPSGQRSANQSYDCTTTRVYSQSGTSVLVKFTVTNSLGLSATDTRRYSIGNTWPWIVLKKPLNNAVLPPGDVYFNFTPYDNEQEKLDCQFLLDGSSVGLGTLKNNTEFTKTVSNVGLGQHYWAVSCSDGINTNTSETRKFYVQPLPILSCIVSNECGTLTPMLSLSGLTNAHVDSSPLTNTYPYKLCCNLTKTGDPENYLQNAECGLLTSSQPFISLSSPSNAHAAAPSVWPDTLYPIKKCFNVSSLTPSVTFSCSTKKDPCDSGETCVLTLSSDTNAHVASCDNQQAYGNKICCKVIVS